MLELEKAQSEVPFTSESFASELIMRLGQKGDGEALSSADVSLLSDDERAEVVQGLLQTQDHFFTDTRRINASDGANRSETPSVEPKLALPRNDGETDEAYLFRGWHNYERRASEQSKEMFKSIAAATAGLSDAMKSAISPGLLANTAASSRLSDVLRDMHWPTRSIAGDITKLARDIGSTSLVESVASAGLARALEQQSAPRLHLQNIPPNPAHKTNDLLSEVSARIAQMTELAATTAEMNQSLNDVTRAILTEFSKGAADSKKATGRALLIAGLSVVISMAAIGATIWSVYHQDVETIRRDRLDAPARAERMAADRATAATLNRLATAIEQDRSKPPATNVKRGRK